MWPQVLSFQDNLSVCSGFCLPLFILRNRAACPRLPGTQHLSFTAQEQTEPLNLTFNRHNSHRQRITCRKVGKQTNPDHSPGDLCLISLQSISRRALGKGSCAIALVWVLLTWSLDTSENLCQQGLYRHCNFLAAGAAKNKVPPRPSGPSHPKKDPWFADYPCQTAKG